MSTPSFRQRARDLLKSDAELRDVEEEEDDEETLQLKLQEIQARLKLKKLQKANQKPEVMTSNTGAVVGRAGSAMQGRAQSPPRVRSRPDIAGLEEERAQRAMTHTSIHVPVSPVRRAQPVKNPQSPGRVLLGIDKGLKGSDVSLRRAPTLRRDSTDRHQNAQQAGSFLHRITSEHGQQSSTDGAQPQTSVDLKRPRTFNERIADDRALQASRRERDARIKKSRSTAFGIDDKEMEGFKNAAVAIPEVLAKPPEFSREQVLGAFNRPIGRTLESSRSSITSRASSRTDSLTAANHETSVREGNTLASATISKPVPKVRSKRLGPADVSETEASQFDPFSATHLSKRILPHSVLTRTLAGKKSYLIPDFLKDVKAPDFDLPDVEEDIVLLAIVATKSAPRAHKSSGKGGKDDRGKYMVITLTDLKWELDLFLFNSGFDKFWKLTPGTVIAILNPNIMAPPQGKADTGRFSLTITSDEDTVLEIGNARDLGFCKSVKKDGKTCDSWIDKRHTEFCEFHVNATLQRTKAGRMEVNTMTSSFGPRPYRSRDVTGFVQRKEEAEKRADTKFDRDTQTRVYIGTVGRGTTKMLDEDDYDPDALQYGSKGERVRKRFAEQEKERDIARKLGSLGSGLGSDYMRVWQPPQVHPSNVPEENGSAPPPPDAAALGLLAGKGKAAEIHLSPVKRKRTNTMSSSSAVGWGGQLTTELGRLKDGESLRPVKKKTRFVTEKGIREAGRESLGAVHDKKGAGSDDDDELDIIG